MLLLILTSTSGIDTARASGDATVGTWTSGPSLLIGREESAAATAADGRIYVFGGVRPFYDGVNSSLTETEAYAPGASAWVTRAPMPTGRYGLGAARGSDDRIYVVGGQTCDGGSCRPLSTVEAYDPGPDRWAAVTSLPAPRTGAAVVAGKDGRIYAIGGATFVPGSSTTLSSVLVYDPLAPSKGWVQAAPLNIPRYLAGAAPGLDGHIYVIGGFDSNAREMASVEVYDPKADVWKVLGSMPTARSDLAASVDQAGNVYAIGGYDISAKSLNTVEMYSPATGTWLTEPPLTTARATLAAVTAANGEIYAIGGDSGPDGHYLTSIEIYTPPGPSLTASVGSGVAGTIIAVSGSRFSPSQTITLKWDNTITLPVDDKEYSVPVRTDADGSFSVRLLTPATTIAASLHQIVASDGSGKSAAISFGIIGSPTPPMAFLDLPFTYDGTPTAFAEIVQNWNSSDGKGTVMTWFDHDLPIYGANADIWPSMSPSALTSPSGGQNCYNNFCYDNHDGIDFGYPEKTPVHPAANGVVVDVETDCPEGVAAQTGCGGGFGNHVVLYHSAGYFTLYGHLRPDTIPATIVPGATVATGDVLGQVGSSGRVTGPHLHFGVYRDISGTGQWQNVFHSGRPYDAGEDPAVDPFGWQAGASSAIPSDPWVQVGGPPSFDLWRNSLRTIVSVATSQLVTIVDAVTGATVLVQPGTFAEMVTLLVSPSPVASPPDQRRQVGLPLWLETTDNASPSASAGLAGALAAIFPGAEAASDTVAQPITITIPFGTADLAHVDPSSLTVYRWDPTVGTWQPLPTTVDLVSHRATAQTSQLGQFSLQGSTLCATAAPQPDGNYLQAQPITIGGAPLARSFDSAADVHWVSFSATQGTTYGVATQQLASGVDTAVRLYDADGTTQLATTDSNRGAGAQLTWIAPADGTYFLEAASGQGGATGCSATWALSILTVSDTTAPTTTASVAPQPDTAGWNSGPVTVTLSAADDQGGSGVKQITYSATGAQPIASTTVNGASASFGVSAAGQTTITYYATDNAGNQEQSKTLTVQIDPTAPTGTVSVVAGPPKQAIVTVQDAGSGLASIQVTESTNATYTVPAFTTGTTQPVQVAFTKVDQSQGAAFALTATDVAGNSVALDPADVGVDRATGKPVSTTIAGVQGYERTVAIQNGTPGLTNLDIAVNGQHFTVAGQKDGTTTTLDIGAALRPGGSNTVVLTPKGKPGGSAEVVISGSAKP